MTNLLRISVVMGLVLGSSSLVMAQSRGERAANEAYAQSWNDRAPVRARTRIYFQDPAHNSRNDVYDGQQYIGSDPSAQVRNEMARDRDH
jgi:hypothetical protein